MVATCLEVHCASPWKLRASSRLSGGQVTDRLLGLSNRFAAPIRNSRLSKSPPRTQKSRRPLSQSRQLRHSPSAAGWTGTRLREIARIHSRRQLRRDSLESHRQTRPPHHQNFPNRAHPGNLCRDRRFPPQRARFNPEWLGLFAISCSSSSFVRALEFRPFCNSPDPQNKG